MSKNGLTAERALSIKTAGDPQISPDGTKVAYVVHDLERSSSDIWVVTVSGRDARNLTRSQAVDRCPRWSPDGLRLAFVSDRPENKNGPKGPRLHCHQILIVDPDGEDAWSLASFGGPVTDIDWAPDGKRIAFTVTESTVSKEERTLKEAGISVGGKYLKMHQIWTAEIRTQKTRQLTRDRSSKAHPRWSPSGRRIVYEQYRTPNAGDAYDSVLWLIDSKGRNRRQLSEAGAHHTDPCWAPDGKVIAFIHNREGRYTFPREVAVVSPRGGKLRNLSRPLDRSVREVTWSANGKHIYFVAQDGTQEHIYSVSREGKEIKRITQGERVLSGLSLSRDGRRMAFRSSSPKIVSEICVASLNGSAEKVLTNLRSQWRGCRTGQTRKVTWKAPDGLAIEGLLVLPPEFKSGVPLPTILWCHGGPPAANVARCQPDWLALAENGYAVFAPNFRGSTGYGKQFTDANLGDIGGGDFADIMSGLDMLVEKGVTDPRKIGVWGHSYGGHMAVWAIAHSDRFKAAVAGAGSYDLAGYWGTTDIQFWTEMYLGALPWQKPDLYSRLSPLTYVESIRTPVLIYHGENDPIVPIAQSRQLYSALRRLGVTVEFVKYIGGHHSVSGYSHWVDYFTRPLGWLDRHLRGLR